MLRTQSLRGHNARDVCVILTTLSFLCTIANAAGAQTRHFFPTLSAGFISQETRGFGYVGTGLVATGGVEFRRLGPFSLRGEAVVARFFSGASAEPSCVEDCAGSSTPSSLVGASASIVLMPDGWPVYAAIGIGTWGVPSSSSVGFEQGLTATLGIPIPAVSGLSLEARYDHPRSPIGLMVSAFSLNLRFTR